MKRIIFSICLLAIGGAATRALKITVEPGKLSAHRAEIELTLDDRIDLSGSANVVDLLLLKNLSENVRMLDMSELTVEAYEYPAGADSGRLKYDAGELPEFMLAGAKIPRCVLPQNTSVVAKGSFIGSALESIEIPATVEHIADYAFGSCVALKNVAIKGNPAYGRGVFKDCPVLKEVSFSTSPASVSDDMFQGCTAYAQTIPSSVRKVGNNAYRGTAVSTINLRNITEVGDFAFADMPMLETVTYSSNGQVQLGKGAFYNDPGLTEIPQMMTELRPLVYARTKAKSQNVINSPVIGEGAYANNPNIDTITLGADVKSIASNAFRNLTGLKLVDVERLKKNMPEVDENAFAGLLKPNGRYDIPLNVDRGSNEVWEQHPVWGLFNVGQYVTGVTGIDLESVEIAMGRAGDVVEISSNCPIEEVEVYTLEGILVNHVSPNASQVSLMELPADKVLVVKATAGGISKVAKLR